MAGSGRSLPPPLLRLLLGVQFSLDLRMGNGNKTLHEIRELAEIALHILGGMDGLLWHVSPSEMRVAIRATKVNTAKSTSNSCGFIRVSDKGRLL